MSAKKAVEAGMLPRRAPDRNGDHPEHRLLQGEEGGFRKPFPPPQEEDIVCPNLPGSAGGLPPSQTTAARNRAISRDRDTLAGHGIPLRVFRAGQCHPTELHILAERKLPQSSTCLHLPYRQTRRSAL